MSHLLTTYSGPMGNTSSPGRRSTPGRHVGTEAVEEGDTPLPERFAALQEKLEAQFEKSDWLTAIIRERLSRVLPE